MMLKINTTPRDDATGIAIAAPTRNIGHGHIVVLFNKK